MIRAIDFHKAYESTVAVAGLSFAVLPGQVFGLVGPNGAGKTTTLRALSGLVPATRGRLEIAGLDVEQHPIAIKQQTAYVPDDPQLFDDLTVGQHMDFFASVYRVADAETKTHQLLQTFDLIEKVDQRANALSRGMRQKLAVCCGYLYSPQAILLDEPMTGLDPPGIRNLLESVRQRAADGAAIMISSHLLAMIESVCTHVLVLDRGRSKFCGPIDTFKSQFESAGAPASLEQAFFAATSGELSAGASL
ncbi:ABC-type transporter ATP-binding protein EcsA [Rosistilla carotiformis]|uniref:ABC-type transporter ATP-binding protein EcsA n=1 Tax=Rosistilla carotiformis TaxID=2528017 RepID=A0A518JPQ1_9BACT|nr:ABC transporter ATP-binding protein [Rosistilla carotiformis]QDV67514.1 ABC-type transporter ATP-binding protein EcsA [Rosistilla carotiformis]